MGLLGLALLQQSFDSYIYIYIYIATSTCSLSTLTMHCSLPKGISTRSITCEVPSSGNDMCV